MVGMTLDEVCKIGKEVLDDFKELTPSDARTQQVEPVLEKCSERSGDPLTDEEVRSTVLKVLNRLAALPAGTWTTPPQLGNVGGLSAQAIRKGNVALSFRFQYDTSILESVLLVGGHISEEKQKATTGR